LTEVEGEEKSLKSELRAVEDGMGEAARQLNQFKRLESELVSAKELYNAYLKKHGETTATSGASLGSVRVIDHATVPVIPFKPHIVMNLSLAAVVGLLLGAGAMFVTEQLDDRVASPREIEAFVGLDVVAVIPKLSTSEKAGANPVLLDEASELPEFEAFRGLRADLITRLEKVQGAKVVCVLSALQSEGKSTVTANLAKVLAMEGRRVLIFDADLRRPAQRKLLGLRDGAGFEEVLRGEASLEQGVQKTRIKGVDVLGAQQGTTGAAELAGTARLEEALAWARRNYDYVLIDSAPVNLVSESSLVARHADLTLLIVRQGTSRGAAQAARKRLDAMGVRLAGSVLNGSSMKGSEYGYYYTTYYSQPLNRG
jgi:capsular exopolysaccharide synthesis family protein